MFGWFKTKTLPFNVAEFVVSKIDLKPGEQLFVTFKSDYIDEHTVRLLRDQFKSAFPNNKVALFAMSPDDDVKFDIVNPLEEKKDGPTNG